MAEIMGIGITHYPPLLGQPGDYANLLRLVKTSHLVPEAMKDPSGWPPEMRDEWDNELERALEHQQRHRDAMHEVRRVIDDFRPDAVIIFGDDQYENFKEDVIPPFNIYCMDTLVAQPFTHIRSGNIWGVDREHSFEVPGAGKLGRTLADAIISRHFPIAYSYGFLHHKTLTHAFANAMVFLDWDQRGWPYPIVPIAVNCYGTSVIHARGGFSQLFDRRPESEKDPYLDTPGPAGPTPATCFRLGQTLRQSLDELPGRYVVMASSGWSHAFLAAKHHWLYPDQAFDRARFEELRGGGQRVWAELDNQAIDDAGSQEFKNWICLSGVVPERTPRIVDYIETWIFNSQKCFAVFES